MCDYELSDHVLDNLLPEEELAISIYPSAENPAIAAQRLCHSWRGCIALGCISKVNFVT